MPIIIIPSRDYAFSTLILQLHGVMRQTNIIQTTNYDRFVYRQKWITCSLIPSPTHAHAAFRSLQYRTASDEKLGTGLGTRPDQQKNVGEVSCMTDFVGMVTTREALQCYACHK